MDKRDIVRGSYLLVFAAVAGGCKREPPRDYAPPPPPASAAPAPASAKPAAPAYTPEQAATLLRQLEGCQYDFNCDAYKPLVSYGDKVSKELAAIATDPSKKGQKVAIQALGAIKDQSVGMQLYAAGRKTKDFMVRGDLATAAGKCGNDDVFAATTKLYSEKLSTDDGMFMTKVLTGFGDRSADWALGKLPASSKAISSTTLANVVRETTKGKPAYLLKIQQAIGKTKDAMARHRLAVAAIELGDMQQFDLLASGLKDGKESLNRSDAGNMLDNVVEKLPSARKDEFIRLLEDAKKKSKGQLEDRGINESLKKLKA